MDNSIGYVCATFEDAVDAVKKTGYPVKLTPAFALVITSIYAANEDGLEIAVKRALEASVTKEFLIQSTQTQ